VAALTREPVVERVRENLARLRAEIDDAAGGRPVQVVAATKYIPSESMPVLARAGVRLVGENRAQDLQAKVQAHGDAFEWDFIGALQSRRVRLIVPHVRLIHSVASDSALRELARHAHSARAGLRILIEVNVAAEPGKAGAAPQDIDELIARSPFPVAGLMTMPPLASDPGASRPYFAALRELARERDLPELSMGTSQDYLVAVQEGATIVRIGATLYE
jgi:uncharacterized pyridoxal phosphate-containing UPF0001 family protein